MPSNPVERLGELDAEVKKLTSTQHKVELKLAENLLTSFLKGFGRLGSFTRTKNNDLQYAWLLLTTRSFNSLCSAYALLQQGYYDQAIMLIRSVEEDWLTATDCEKNSETLKAVFQRGSQLGKGQLSYAEMAKRISAEFYA